MNKNYIPAAMLAALMLALPASGYHIVVAPPVLGTAGLGVAIPPAAVPYTPVSGPLALNANDFVLANPALLLCESTSPTDPVNPGLSTPGVLEFYNVPGVGGLCYSGRNALSDVSGVALPVAQPAAKTWTEFDLCNELTSSPAPCTETGWAYLAELGMFSCFIFAEQSFVYDEAYAWMTWDVGVAGGNGHVAAFPDLVVSVVDSLLVVTIPNLPALVLTNLLTVNPHPLLPAPTGVLVGSAATQPTALNVNFVPLLEMDQPCGASDPNGPNGGGPVGVRLTSTL
ncbi:MAG: hypothetical protein QOD77_1753 [Thermoplasmata archaeon]|jgi:hypothetical protein|nr:hypothetical protein [Thermoplasmata archaeon]